MERMAGCVRKRSREEIQRENLMLASDLRQNVCRIRRFFHGCRTLPAKGVRLYVPGGARYFVPRLIFVPTSERLQLTDACFPHRAGAFQPDSKNLWSYIQRTRPSTPYAPGNTQFEHLGFPI